MKTNKPKSNEPLSVGIITFSRSLVSVKLSEDHLRFYFSTVDSLTQGKIHFLLKEGDTYKSVEIKRDSIEGELETISLPFPLSVNEKKLNELIKTQIDSWKLECNIIIIDLTSHRNRQPFRAIELDSITNTIQELLEITKNKYKFILLIQTLLDEDVSLPDEKNINIICIDDSGQTRGNWSPIAKFNRNKYQTKLIKLIDNPLELLKLKMIRRVGHFKSTLRCTEYMYDGKLCRNELMEILYKCFLFDQKKERKKPLYIIYNCPPGHWLEDPVTFASGKLDLVNVTKSFEEFEKEKEKNKREIEENNYDVFLVFPMINTGSNLEKIAESIGKTFIQQNNFRIMSILSYREDEITFQKELPTLATINSEFNYIEFLKTIKKSFEVYYIMESEKLPYRDEFEDCPMCKLNIPTNDFYKDDFLMLGTYFMWKILDDCGWVPENDHPPQRSELNLIPDFEKMIDKYKDWISYKLFMLVNYYALFPEIIIVYPEGYSIESIVEYLQIVKKIQSIKIPRNIIEMFSNAFKEEDLNSATRLDDWYQELKYISVNKSGFKIIILDTMIMSGNTIKGLRKILSYFNCEANIQSCFFIMDFRPKEDPKFMNSDVFSLYRLPLFTS